MSPLWDFQVHIKLITHISHDYFITPIYRMTSDTSAASSTFAQLRTIGCVLFKRVRDFWKMMLRLAVIFKAHTFAGGMDVFPSCFVLSEFLLAEKDLKPSRFALPKQGGRREEGGVWRYHRDGIRKPICTTNSVISWTEKWGMHFAKSIGIQFCGHFTSVGFWNISIFMKCYIRITVDSVIKCSTYWQTWFPLWRSWVMWFLK